MEEDEEEHDVFGGSDDALEMDELKDSVPLGRMGLPIRPRMSRASATDSGRPTGRNRRSSVFEENAVRGYAAGSPHTWQRSSILHPAKDPTALEDLCFAPHRPPTYRIFAADSLS